MEAHSSSENSVLQTRLAKLADLQEHVQNEPYSIISRLQLALAYKHLGYPDLAVGDAYKGLLLVDEVAEEGEYHDEAMSAAHDDINSQQATEFSAVAHREFLGLNHAECCCLLSQVDDLLKPEEDNGDDSRAVTWAKGCWSKTAYSILVGCLRDCGCLKSAFEFNSRALKAFPNDSLFESYQESLVQKIRSHFAAKGEDFDSVDVREYPDKGCVRREVYPWNSYEPDRFAPESLEFLNEEMAKVAPKLEVKMVELPLLAPWSAATSNSTSDPVETCVKQLGIFAKEDIAPGEVILEEKSLLTGVARLRESFCDACSISLSALGVASADIRACEDCDETYFCSGECQDLAQETYHPALCGVTIDEKVPSSEAADFLYTLLLVRALALAETQDLHPLELKEVRYIWGDYHGLNLERTWQADSRGHVADPFATIPQTLPFSFKGNIFTPLNILEKMDINIFEQSHRYDTWVFNTLYGKFRGTASARQGLDGRPEVSAVHPMWCLGNHSCDPNVAWEWQGSIKFWTRGELVPWEGRSQTLKAGIPKGGELLSHYCDVTLPVKERREWAVGALGGDCMCPRCVWEAAEEKKHAASE